MRGGRAGERTLGHQRDRRFWQAAFVGTRLFVVWLAIFGAMLRCVRADEFRHLSGAEIRAQVTGKQITDEVHWSETYERGGRLLVSDMGHPSMGTWRIKNDLLCIDRPGFNACYEVWLAAPKIQLRVLGDRNYFTVLLKQPPIR